MKFFKKKKSRNSSFIVKGEAGVFNENTGRINQERLIRSFKHWVYVCVNRNASAVSATPLNLYIGKNSGKSTITRSGAVSQKQIDFLKWYQKDKTAGTNSIEEIYEHPFLDLIRKPNSYTNYNDLLYSTTMFLDLTGDAYWFHSDDENGLPREIHLIPPQMMTVVIGGDAVKGYQYSHNEIDIFLHESEVVHFKYQSPLNRHYGFSPLAAGWGSFQMRENMDEYESNLFRNKCTPPMIFKTTDRVSDSDRKRLISDLKRQHSGVRNGTNWLFLQNVELVKTSFSPQEVSYLSGRQETKEELCAVFGQTASLYDKDATRANVEGAIFQHAKFGILPRCLNIQSKINEKLISLYPGNLFCGFENPVPEDREIRRKERESNLNLGVTVINEERRRDGMGKVPWGDFPYLPLNKIQVKEGHELYDYRTEKVNSKDKDEEKGDAE